MFLAWSVREFSSRKLNSCTSQLAKATKETWYDLDLLYVAWQNCLINLLEDCMCLVWKLVRPVVATFFWKKVNHVSVLLFANHYNPSRALCVGSPACPHRSVFQKLLHKHLNWATLVNDQHLLNWQKSTCILLDRTSALPTDALVA